jgi:hypothetical protein
VRVFTEIGRPGCIVTVSGPLGKPAECHRSPTYAGLAFFEYPRPRVWLVFACDEHFGQLIAARRMLERDRAELARRAARRQRVLEEKAPLEPLAVGSNARRLVERARAWAARDQDLSSTVDSPGGADVGHRIPVSPRDVASRETQAGL